MKAISLFSGVGGFEIGFERAGIETVLQAEQDKWCLSVLEKHWPNTRRVTDVRDVGDRGLQGEAVRRAGGGPWHPGGADVYASSERTRTRGIDLIYGGFPCQDLSVAGARAGLNGERSGLFFEFARILADLRPQWCVIENVPGLLSSNKGRDFATVLDSLDELGYGVAWTILDAQHFGVPQRRRRVFVVGCLGDWRPAAEVLSLEESSGRNPSPRRKAGQDTPASIAVRLAQTGSNGWGIGVDGQAYTLDGAQQAVLANPLGAHHGRMDLGHDTYIPETAWALQERDAKGPDSSTKEGHLLPSSAGVRRLTPRECERLMGWPDDWTRWGADGKEIADSHRYRMCGNGVVAPVAEWIGHRLAAANALLNPLEAAA